MSTVGLEAHPVDEDLRTCGVAGHHVSVEEEYDSDTSNAAHSRESITTVSGSGAAEDDAAQEKYTTVADSFAGMDLKASMPRRKLRLEREREAALAANEPRCPPQTRSQKIVAHDLPLGLILKPHVSRLERERKAALADPLPRHPSPRNETSLESTKLENGESEQRIDEILVKHKSRLEKAKEEGVIRSVGSVESCKGVQRSAQPPPLPLESLLVKTYSRLEREKLKKGNNVEVNSPAASGPKSRLQLELEAAKRLFGQDKEQK